MKILIKDLIKHPLHTINSHKELRYVVAGTASEVIEYVSFVILVGSFHLLYVSNSISFILGVVSGFIFHKTWSFRGDQQFKTHQQFVGYISLAAVNFIMINIFIGVYVHEFNIKPDLAKLLAIASTLIWTYSLTNLFVFRHRKTDSQSK